MIESNIRNKHPILSAGVVICGLLYIFIYQLKLPFRADTFLYGMLIGLLVMNLLQGRIVINRQFALLALLVLSAWTGVLYTTRISEGMREAILLTFFACVYALSYGNPSLINSFTKWVFWFSVIVVLSSICHFLLPNWFNSTMEQIMRADAYEQLMWSYTVDDAFAGLSAYTPNTTFSAGIVVGYAFLNITRKIDRPIINNRIINIILLVLALFSIIICSKRGVFVATVFAMIVLLFYLYRGRHFLIVFLGGAFVFIVALVILYQTNSYVASFLNRFVSGNFLTGRDQIYSTLIGNFSGGNILFGCGTAATYAVAGSGAHNIYLQILYDHGILLSIPYYVFLINNYYIAFKRKCPVSIFVQTLFLVYGLSGNPLYSNMFMLIYIYNVLYAVKVSSPQKHVRGAEPMAAQNQAFLSNKRKA